jgi:hypothetical protein
MFPQCLKRDLCFSSFGVWQHLAVATPKYRYLVQRGELLQHCDTELCFIELPLLQLFYLFSIACIGLFFLDRRGSELHNVKKGWRIYTGIVHVPRGLLHIFSLRLDLPIPMTDGANDAQLLPSSCIVQYLFSVTPPSSKFIAL